MPIAPAAWPSGTRSGLELQKRGLHYTPHYTLPLMGRYLHELIDAEAGVYRYDHLFVLHSTAMSAVLLETGSIVNRQEELELATPERRLTLAEAVTAAVEDFCASRGQAVAGRLPARNQAGVAIPAPSRGIRRASSSRVITTFMPQNVVARFQADKLRSPLGPEKFIHCTVRLVDR